MPAISLLTGEPAQHVGIQACQNGGQDGTPLCRDGYAASAVPPRCIGDDDTAAVRCCADARLGEPCGEDVAENLCQMPHVSVTVGTEVDTLTDAVVRAGSVRHDPALAPRCIIPKTQRCCW